MSEIFVHLPHILWWEKLIYNKLAAQYWISKKNTYALFLSLQTEMMW